MDWTAHLAERRKNISEGHSVEVPKLTKPGFGTFGTPSPPPPQKKSAADTAALRTRLLGLADTYGHDAALVRTLPEAELVAWCEYFRTLAPERHAEALRVWLALHDDAERKAGRVPPGDTAAMLCAHCGPVWIHPSIAAVLPVVDGWPRALGCPWCFIRAAGGYIPRPAVRPCKCAAWHPDTINAAGGRGQCQYGSWWPGQPHACSEFIPRATR